MDTFFAVADSGVERGGVPIDFETSGNTSSTNCVIA